MRSQNLQNRITELFSFFVTEVKGHTAMGKTDINRIAETVLIPLLKEVYGYRDLKNLNDSKGNNYPAIDLGDETAKIAIQVTATPDSEKIKDTLRGFIKYEHYQTYERVQIYILTEKENNKRSEKSFQEITQNKVRFDIKRDILDYRDLLKKISTFQVEKLQNICNILEANFGNNKVALPLGYGNAPLLSESAPKISQKVYLNLLEFHFPGHIYTADLMINREQVIIKSKKTDYALSQRSTVREIAAVALKQHGLKFGTDWTYHEGKIVTFHDLRNRDLPLAAIIDSSTVENPDSQDFYGRDTNYENIFKSLLGRCLQQKLYHLDVVWQHEEKLFIFAEVDGRPERKEQWQNNRPGRIVYKRIMKNNKPNEILHCKHFGFRTRYTRFGQKWYISIVPDWFFSFDRYRKSFFAKKNLDWLKNHENDKAVCNNLRFVATFLKEEKPSDLFRQYASYPFLSFGNLVTFDSAPLLNDKEWLPSRDKDVKGQMELTINL